MALTIIPILVLSLSVPTGIGSKANRTSLAPGDPIAAARARLLASGPGVAGPTHIPALPPADSDSASLNLPNLRMPDTPAASSFTVEAKRRQNKRAWLLLAVAQHGAATLDAYSTRQVLGSGHGRELDPLLRPFAGSAALYPAIQVAPAFLDFWGSRMMNSRRNWVRRVWWIPQTAATAGFIYSGVHNLGIRRQP